MRSFILSAEEQSQLTALKELVGRVPAKLNPSGTARTLDALWSQVPASGMGMAALLGGGSGILAGIATYLATSAAKEAPAAARLAMLKFMASNASKSAEGFYSASKVASATIKAIQTTKAAVAATVSGTGHLVQVASAKQLEQLDKKVQEYSAEPEKLLAVGGATGHYMPETAAALAQQAGTAVQYLSTLRPSTEPMAPLDPARVPSKIEQMRYESALQIAQQPLTVLNKVKNGSITPTDIKDLQSMYPELYLSLQQKLVDGVINAKDKGISIPMQTKRGIGMFTNQIMDSAMKPINMMINQQVFAPQQQFGAQQKPIKNVNKLDKLPSALQTPEQAREKSKISGH